MRILAVDDEQLMLGRLERCIREAAPEAELISFQKATECLSYVRKQQADVAFLDIRMRLMDGMELARQIKVLQPNMNIIFTTGYSDYIYDAVSEIRCSGYILKPVTTEQIAGALENLWHPIEEKPKEKGEKVTIPKATYSRYLGGYSKKEANLIIEKALAYYFENNEEETA